MKLTRILISLFVLTACNSKTDNNVINENDKTVSIDSNEINGAEGKPVIGIHKCNFENYIADEKTPKLAKDIYLDKDWNFSNDNESLALLDSLTAKDRTYRPFYFKIITKTFIKSDGYYSEGLGLAGKEYVENNTKEFVANFDNKDCFTYNDLLTWAKIVVLEFSIIGEGEYDKPLVDDYIKKLKSNCKDCSPTQNENINAFGFLLKSEWKDFLKNID